MLLGEESAPRGLSTGQDAWFELIEQQKKMLHSQLHDRMLPSMSLSPPGSCTGSCEK